MCDDLEVLSCLDELELPTFDEGCGTQETDASMKAATVIIDDELFLINFEGSGRNDLLNLEKGLLEQIKESELREKYKRASSVIFSKFNDKFKEWAVILNEPIQSGSVLKAEVLLKEKEKKKSTKKRRKGTPSPRSGVIKKEKISLKTEDGNISTETSNLDWIKKEKVSPKKEDVDNKTSLDVKFNAQWIKKEKENPQEYMNNTVGSDNPSEIPNCSWIKKERESPECTINFDCAVKQEESSSDSSSSSTESSSSSDESSSDMEKKRKLPSNGNIKSEPVSPSNIKSEQSSEEEECDYEANGEATYRKKRVKKEKHVKTENHTSSSSSCSDSSCTSSSDSVSEEEEEIPSHKDKSRQKEEDIIVEYVPEPIAFDRASFDWRTVKGKKAKPVDVIGRNPISILNELVARNAWPSAVYEVVKEVGRLPHQSYLIKVKVNGKEFMPKEPSRKKKDAKVEAAKTFLVEMGYVTDVSLLSPI